MSYGSPGRYAETMRGMVVVLTALAACGGDSHPPGDSAGAASVGAAGAAGLADPAGAGASAGGAAGVAGMGAASAASPARDDAGLPDAGVKAPASAHDAGVASEADASRFVGTPGTVDASVAVPCQDDDGDGFGIGCNAGDDCDDADPLVTDACYRCAEPNDGCPCEPGTRPMFCMPDPIEADGGVYVCSEGSRYCRDGIWSACEAIGEYVFLPSG